MSDLPTDWGALCALVLLLGLRHGFDADHLAAIDGMARVARRHGHRHAGYGGALFSLGHGAVVLAIAGAVGLLSERWSPPAWLGAVGAWVSIGFLLLLGALNLHAVLSAAPGASVALVGVRGGLLARWLGARSPLGVAMVGALFALSFDTVSQAALFAVTATRYGGVGHALQLGLLFVAGMLAADGLNGWWISRLLARADRRSALATRVMGLAVALVSLVVAALGVGRMLSPSLGAWTDARALTLAAAVTTVLALSYVAAVYGTRSAARAG